MALLRFVPFGCALLAIGFASVGCGRHKAAPGDGGREASTSESGHGDATAVDANVGSTADVGAEVDAASDARDASDAQAEAGDAGDARDAADAEAGCPRGKTELASVNAAGAPGNKESVYRFGTMSSTISDDGRFVTFVSLATNLVANASFPGVYLRDTCRGAGAACVPATTLVSVTKDGKPSDGIDPWLSSATISGSGRYVAFVSRATDLVAGGRDFENHVYVRDTCFGAVGVCTPSTTRASVTSAGVAFTGDSVEPTLSGDGRYVLFTYAGADLSPDGSLLIRDTCAGATNCTPRTIDISTLPDASRLTNGTLSRDGRFVLFTAPLPGGNGQPIFVNVFDTCIGAPGACTRSVTWANPGLNGEPGNNDVISAMVTRGGRYVVFTSFASNMVAGDKDQLFDVFVRDTCIGAGATCTPKTIRASIGDDGSEPNSHVRNGIATEDGRYVFFQSDATTLAQNDSHPKIDVFVRDTCIGAVGACTPSTKFVVWARCGAHPDDDVNLVGPSADGRAIVVQSKAQNLEGPKPIDLSVFVVTTGL